MKYQQVPKILIVEGNLIIAADLSVQLQLLGYDVLGVHTKAEDALLTIERTPPDILMTDISLKGKMNGIILANHIKNTSKIPVLFISAYTNESMFSAMIRTKPYGFISKPFTQSDLKKGIAIVLEQIAYKKRSLGKNHSIKESNRSDNKPFPLRQLR